MIFLFQEGFLPLAGFPGSAENASLAYSPAFVMKKAARSIQAASYGSI